MVCSGRCHFQMYILERRPVYLLVFHWNLILMDLASNSQNGMTHTIHGLVTPYGDRDMGQHWVRQWIAAWRHQTITRTNVDLSPLRSSGTNLRAISREIPQPSTIEISLQNYWSKIYSNLKKCFKSPFAAIFMIHLSQDARSSWYESAWKDGSVVCVEYHRNRTWQLATLELLSPSKWYLKKSLVTLPRPPYLKDLLDL